MMSKNWKIATSICLLALTGVANTSWARTWTNTEGKTITADFIKLEDGVVHLKKNGHIYKVPLEKLSKSDQLLANELASEKKEQPKSGDEQTPEASNIKLPIKFTTKISGGDLTHKQVAGKPIVIHQWQAHCGACPPSLASFEKMARRKKRSGASFLIWHSADKTSLAKKKAESLRLKLPVYHGGAIKWDKKFGKAVWPHVVLINSQGKITYMGKADNNFNRELKKLSEE